MKRELGFILFLFLLFRTSNGFFSVHAPKIIRPNSVYSVAVSQLGNISNRTVNLKIKGPNLQLDKNVNLNSFASEIVYFNIPDISEKAELFVEESYSQYSNKKTLDFPEDKDNYLIFIQTDRAAYKPGDLVKFRVIVLDKNTRPIKSLENINILISDANDTDVQYFENVQFQSGVFTSQYKLSEQPTLGNWKIAVEQKSKELRKQKFEVAHFVLPSFYVRVTSETIRLKPGKGEIKINANYTFGKPVEGIATLTIKTVDSSEDESPFIKTFPIKGGAIVPISLENDLGINVDSIDSKLNITVTVKEKFTERKQSDQILVDIKSTEYVIHRNFPKEFYPDVPTKISFFIETWRQRPVTDNINKVTLYAVNGDTDDELKFETYVTKGNAEFFINFPSDGEYFNLKVEYGNVEENLGIISKFKETDLRIVNYKKLKLHIGSEIPITVRSNNTLDLFQYVVIARESVVHSEVLQLPGRRVQEFNIPVTFEMVPTCKVIVSTIINGNLKSDFRTYEVEGYNNNMKLEFNKYTTLPGSTIDVKIETEPHSFVGLLAVDKRSVLFKSGNDLTKDLIEEKLKALDSNAYILSNAGDSHTGLPGGPPDGPNPTDTSSGFIRDFFPETWIWDNVNTSDELTTTKRKTVPDTITSWILTGFTIHPEKGLALTNSETILTAIKPFFVNFELPYSVKLGEDLSFDVLIFNYLNKTEAFEVSLQKREDFEILTNDDDDDDDSDIKVVEVEKNSLNSVNFRISPMKIGKIPITVTAKSENNKNTDGIQKILLVEPNGITKFDNKEMYIKLDNGQEFQQKVKLEFPENIIPNSEFIKLSVSGSIMGPTIDNLNNLIQTPKGCGEQLMVDFVPNILVLNYLNVTHQRKPEAEEQAKANLVIGYQEILNHRQKDGSFSVFPKVKGSAWLTAYVARSLQQAKNYIFIDPKIINKAYECLIKNQKPSGQFKAMSKTITNHYEKSLVLTSFVLTAFAEDPETLNKYENVIKKSSDYIAKLIGFSKENLYALSIGTYALTLANHPKAKDCLEELESKAQNNNDFKWWQNSTSEISTFDVEITSYALLSLMKTKTTEEVLPIVRWLISQRNQNGGFASSQDTVVGLTALTKFTEMLTTDMRVSVISSDKLYNFNVNSSNALVVQQRDLEKNSRRINIAAEGKGACLVKISYQYNIGDNVNPPYFNLNVTAEKVNDKVLIVKFCVSKTDGESNMAYVNVDLPSGYTADEEAINNDTEDEVKLEKTEYKNNGNRVVFYIDSITNIETCLPVKAIRTFIVNGTKKTNVKVGDFYDSKKFVTESYSVDD